MKKEGFSILELAIVLVIIGLVTGGIIQGVVLMENAELKRVAKDFSDFHNAINLFQDKYSYYPGDIPIATQIWGRADGGADLTANCNSPDTDIDPNNPMATCNGNGDQEIASKGGLVVINTEAYRLWQHLSNAGYIPGRYTGIGGTMGSSWRNATPDNVPSSAVKNGGYFIQASFQGAFCAAGEKWTNFQSTHVNNKKPIITLGRFNYPTGIPTFGILTPQQSEIIDIKIDDGRPGLGNVFVTCAPDCADSSDAQTANYLKDVDNVDCSLKYIVN